MSYVIASGLQYGLGENVFHLLFKVSFMVLFACPSLLGEFFSAVIITNLCVQTAWLGFEPSLKVFGDGQNVVPTIHIRDLARFESYLTMHPQYIQKLH